MAKLVAQGLTNRQIAARLVISERTAESHVEQIRNKLGFHSRSQIAAWVTARSDARVQALPPTETGVAMPHTTRPGLRVDRRLRIAVGGLVVALLIGGGLALLTVFNVAAPRSAAASLDGLVEIDPASGKTVGTVPTSNQGDALVLDGGSIWEINYAARTLSQINPATRAVIASGVPGPAPPVGLAAGPDSIWVSTAFGDKSLLRFDKRTRQWDQPITVASGLQQIAYGASSVWVVDKVNDAVYRVDPSTSLVTARIPVGQGPEAIAATSNSIWVANTVGNTVSRIDPASNAVTATIALRGPPTGIAVGAGAVWGVSESAGLLIQIDVLTNAAVEVPFGVGPTAVLATGSGLWVVEGVAGRISRVDPGSYKAISTVAISGSIDGAAADGRSLWITRHVLADPALPGTTLSRGGVLRVVMPAWKPSALANPNPKEAALDPQIGGNTLDSNEILRCCLLRTLMSHVGRSYRDGGAELRPDLAVRWPDVSQDGLAWTFTMRRGLHYAPPMQQTEIVAEDVVRALQRDAQVAGSTTYSGIVGFDAYARGRGNPSTIPGLEVLDRYTLKVHLSQVTGDLPYRFALSESAPIPPSSLDRNAAFGIATGHDTGYGRYLVASGPYMIAGSPSLNFTRPAERQLPVSGLQPGKLLALVRNPSWSPAADPLRPAYVSELRFTIGGSDEEAARMLEIGQADVILHGSPPPQVLPSFIDKVQTNPSLGRVVVNERDFMRAVQMSPLLPPFDDIHVRRAVNYILDKRALVEAHGGASTGRISTHYLSDSLEDGALSGYDPFSTPDDRGSLTLARQEMSQSRYDPLHTGTCTAAECQHVLAYALGIGDPLALYPRLYGGFPRLATLIAEDLKAIGINAEVRTDLSLIELVRQSGSTIPANLTSGLGSAESWMDASSVFGTGAWLANVPNLDARVHECIQGGERQPKCWTSLDIYLMEKIVPIAPYMMETVTDVVPNRVVHYSFDQSSDEVALDQIAVKS